MSVVAGILCCYMAPVEFIIVTSRRVVGCQCRAVHGEPLSERHGQQLSEPGRLGDLSQLQWKALQDETLRFASTPYCCCAGDWC